MVPSGPPGGRDRTQVPQTVCSASENGAVEREALRVRRHTGRRRTSPSVRARQEETRRSIR